MWGKWRHQAVVASGMRVASLGEGRAPVLLVDLEDCREVAALLGRPCTQIELLVRSSGDGPVFDHLGAQYPDFPSRLFFF